MKRILLSIMLVFAVALASFSQDRVDKHTVKVKRTSTFGQKVHNTFSKHKRYNGYKVKRKVRK